MALSKVLRGWFEAQKAEEQFAPPDFLVFSSVHESKYHCWVCLADEPYIEMGFFVCRVSESLQAKLIEGGIDQPAAHFFGHLLLKDGVVQLVYPQTLTEETVAELMPLIITRAVLEAGILLTEILRLREEEMVSELAEDETETYQGIGEPKGNA